MMVSFALLTIKTAALLWFTYGALQGRGTDPSPTPEKRRSPVWVRLQTSKASTGYGEPAEA